MKIDGKQLSEEILNSLILKIHYIKSKFQPTLAVILVGNNPASVSYIRQKQKACEQIGAKFILKEFPITISQIYLISQIRQINADNSIHGLIIQRPLPSHIEKTIINEAVDPSKDIDGFHPKSQYLSPVALSVLHVLYYCFLESNSHFNHEPMEEEKSLVNSFNDLINDFKISNLKFKIFLEWLATQEILLLGRGETGGKPIGNTLHKLKIKYIQTHSKTKDINDLLKQADIIISAVGKPHLITGNIIKKGAICVGLGISRLNQISNIKNQKSNSNNLKLKIENFKLSHNEAIKHTKLVGDFEEQSIASKASFYTPTPGGIGPLNVAFLLDNLVKSCQNQPYDQQLKS